MPDCYAELADLGDPGHPYDGGLPLPLGKRFGLPAIGVDARKFLTIGIVDRDAPMMMPSPLILSECLALPMSDHCAPKSSEFCEGTSAAVEWRPTSIRIESHRTVQNRPPPRNRSSPT